MITDKLRNKVADYIKDNFIDSAKIGQGGNSTNPISNDLDVALSVTPTINKSIAGTSNVIETKVTVAGSSITGKVVREVGLFDGSDMIQRLNFDGVGPFASNEDLEIFIIMEVE